VKILAFSFPSVIQGEAKNPGFAHTNYVGCARRMRQTTVEKVPGLSATFGMTQTIKTLDRPILYRRPTIGTVILEEDAT